MGFRKGDKMEVFVVLVIWGVSLLIAYFMFKAAVKNGVLEALKIFYAGAPPGAPAMRPCVLGGGPCP